MKNKHKVFAVVLLSMVMPGSGYVLLGKSVRGLMMLMWMFMFGYITYKLTTVDISLIGRLSGGLGVWTISVVETHKLAQKTWISK
ncbi:MAG: hypothetical protein JEZ08_02040 [Clostridiales bacterium]|nr:hypothetical protein [Clostridiales bacterium]